MKKSKLISILAAAFILTGCSSPAADKNSQTDGNSEAPVTEAVVSETQSGDSASQYGNSESAENNQDNAAAADEIERMESVGEPVSGDEEKEAVLDIIEEAAAKAAEFKNTESFMALDLKSDYTIKTKSSINQTLGDAADMSMEVTVNYNGSDEVRRAALDFSGSYKSDKYTQDLSDMKFSIVIEEAGDKVRYILPTLNVCINYDSAENSFEDRACQLMTSALSGYAQVISTVPLYFQLMSGSDANIKTEVLTSEEGGMRTFFCDRQSSGENSFVSISVDGMTNAMKASGNVKFDKDNFIIFDTALLEFSGNSSHELTDLADSNDYREVSSEDEQELIDELGKDFYEVIEQLLYF